MGCWISHSHGSNGELGIGNLRWRMLDGGWWIEDGGCWIADDGTWIANMLGYIGSLLIR